MDSRKTRRLRDIDPFWIFTALLMGAAFAFFYVITPPYENWCDKLGDSQEEARDGPEIEVTNWEPAFKDSQTLYYRAWWPATGNPNYRDTTSTRGR